MIHENNSPSIGESISKYIKLTNSGDISLRYNWSITELIVAGISKYEFTFNEPCGIIRPGESKIVQITFEPMSKYEEKEYLISCLFGTYLECEKYIKIHLKSYEIQVQLFRSEIDVGEILIGKETQISITFDNKTEQEHSCILDKILDDDCVSNSEKISIQECQLKVPKNKFKLKKQNFTSIKGTVNPKSLGKFSFRLIFIIAGCKNPKNLLIRGKVRNYNIEIDLDEFKTLPLNQSNSLNISFKNNESFQIEDGILEIKSSSNEIEPICYQVPKFIIPVAFKRTIPYYVQSKICTETDLRIEFFVGGIFVAQKIQKITFKECDLTIFESDIKLENIKGGEWIDKEIIVYHQNMSNIIAKLIFSKTDTSTKNRKLFKIRFKRKKYELYPRKENKIIFSVKVMDSNFQKSSFDIITSGGKIYTVNIETTLQTPNYILGFEKLNFLKYECKKTYNIPIKIENKSNFGYNILVSPYLDIKKCYFYDESNKYRYHMKPLEKKTINFKMKCLNSGKFKGIIETFCPIFNPESLKSINFEGIVSGNSIEFENMTNQKIFMPVKLLGQISTTNLTVKNTGTIRARIFIQIVSKTLDEGISFEIFPKVLELSSREKANIQISFTSFTLKEVKGIISLKYFYPENGNEDDTQRYSITDEIEIFGKFVCPEISLRHLGYINNSSIEYEIKSLTKTQLEMDIKTSNSHSIDKKHITIGQYNEVEKIILTLNKISSIEPRIFVTFLNGNSRVFNVRLVKSMSNMKINNPNIVFESFLPYSRQEQFLSISAIRSSLNIRLKIKNGRNLREKGFLIFIEKTRLTLNYGETKLIKITVLSKKNFIESSIKGEIEISTDNGWESISATFTIIRADTVFRYINLNQNKEISVNIDENDFKTIDLVQNTGKNVIKCEFKLLNEHPRVSIEPKNINLKENEILKPNIIVIKEGLDFIKENETFYERILITLNEKELFVKLKVSKCLIVEEKNDLLVVGVKIDTNYRPSLSLDILGTSLIPNDIFKIGPTLVGKLEGLKIRISNADNPFNIECEISISSGKLENIETHLSMKSKTELRNNIKYENVFNLTKNKLIIDKNDSKEMWIYFHPENPTEYTYNLKIKYLGIEDNYTLKGIGISNNLNFSENKLNFGTIKLKNYEETIKNFQVSSSSSNNSDISILRLVKSPKLDTFIDNCLNLANKFAIFNLKSCLIPNLNLLEDFVTHDFENEIDLISLQNRYLNEYLNSLRGEKIEKPKEKSIIIVLGLDNKYRQKLTSIIQRKYKSSCITNANELYVKGKYLNQELLESVPQTEDKAALGIKPANMIKQTISLKNSKSFDDPNIATIKKYIMSALDKIDFGTIILDGLDINETEVYTQEIYKILLQEISSIFRFVFIIGAYMSNEEFLASVKNEEKIKAENELFKKEQMKKKLQEILESDYESLPVEEKVEIDKFLDLKRKNTNGDNLSVS
ncbi:MAG: hypothetical protein MHPSP_000793, partial [Paramarteilia canceri]